MDETKTDYLCHKSHCQCDYNRIDRFGNQKTIDETVLFWDFPGEMC